LHEVNDQTKTLGTVTKWNALASTPQEIPGMVREAFRQLRSGRPRPVGLEIAYDVLWSKADIELVDPAVGEEGRTEPDAAAVTKAAAMLSNARFPVIYVGGGVHAAKAYEPLRILAERIQAPVVMSDNGRGAISDRHPLALSTLGGRAVLPHSDVVLVVGSRFMEALFPNPVWSSANTRFIFLNADEADFSAPRQVDVKLYGDASLGLDALAAGVRPTTVSRAADMDKVRAWCAQQFGEIEPLWRWLRAVRDAIPDDGILVNELTQVGYLARVAYPVYAPGTFITHGYQGALGYGFATALGVATGNPGRAVVSITGDGGFGWNMQELATLKKYNLDLVTVIFNDGEFGNVRSMQQAEFGYSYAVDLCNPDFGKLADAFGVPCVSVDTPEALQSELVAALRRKGPALIEVKVGVMPNPWHLLRLKTQMKRPSPEPANPLAGGHS
jgi:acetolactate synthase-1/2/3 large subunit